MGKSLVVGDVLVVPFFPHQENKSQGEPRWIILLEDLTDKFEVCPLTHSIDNKSFYKKSFIISASSEEGKAMQLTGDSLVMPERKLQIPKSILNSCLTRGRCSDSLLDKLCEL